MVLSVDGVVVLTEHVGMLHVGCRPFQAVEAEQAQAKNIVTDFGFVFVRGKDSGLALKLAQVVADQL